MFAIQMLRLRGAYVGISSALLLTSCASAPEFPRRVSVSEVMHNARCELYEGVKENIGQYPWLESWTAAFDFSFVVDRNVNASTDTTYLVPVHAGTFSIGLKADLKQEAKGTYAIGFRIIKGFGNFDAYDCDLIRAQSTSPRRLLNGEIGLRRWINDIVPQIDKAWIVNETKLETADIKRRRLYAGETSGTTYAIEFGVTADGSLLPSWSLAFPSKHQFKPGFSFLASEADTHKLIVAMAPKPILAPPPPDDLSGIIGKVDGKDVIVGRRVCVFDPNIPGQCTVAGPQRAALQSRLDAATAEKKTAQTKDSFAAKGIDNVLKNAPPAVKRLSVPSISSNSEEIARDLSPGDAEQLRRLAPQITELQSQRNQAQREERDADEKIRALNSQLSQMPGSVQRRAIATAAGARASAAADEEVSRRLDQQIQQQILRDAFRQAQ